MYVITFRQNVYRQYPIKYIRMKNPRSFLISFTDRISDLNATWVFFNQKERGP